MGFECDLGWEYFGPDPMNSPRMQEHMDWHTNPANKNKLGNYGERFLDFNGGTDPVGFTPGGHRVPIPGGPGDPVWTILPQALRNIAAGIVLHQVTAMVDSEQLKAPLQKTASELAGPTGRAEFQ